MMEITDGGIPRDCSLETLAWLAATHRRLAMVKNGGNTPRGDWHRRWASQIEDLLETYRVNRD